jgi:hypothetical protein
MEVHDVARFASTHRNAEVGSQLAVAASQTVSDDASRGRFDVRAESHQRRTLLLTANFGRGDLEFSDVRAIRRQWWLRDGG